MLSIFHYNSISGSPHFADDAVGRDYDMRDGLARPFEFTFTILYNVQDVL